MTFETKLKCDKERILSESKDMLKLWNITEYLLIKNKQYPYPSKISYNEYFDCITVNWILNYKSILFGISTDLFVISYIDMSTVDPILENTSNEKDLTKYLKLIFGDK